MERNAIQSVTLPHNVRLIAAVSRLIDLHQCRREGGAYIPDVPERAGYFLALALVMLDCLREIELSDGSGFNPQSRLISAMRARIPAITDDDIEYCIANLKQEREIHYGVENGEGTIDLGRTWDTTPLLNVAEGFSQVQLTENARLLMRVSTLRESWMYSDLDADRLAKAIERGQFGDIPSFCRAITLDLANKSRQLTGLMEQPSLSELRELLLHEGEGISTSLMQAVETVRRASGLIFDDRTRSAFAVWSARMNPEFALSNLQADLEYVLQNVERLSRRFVEFVGTAQKVRHHGAERLRFLDIADHLVRNARPDESARIEALLHRILPAGIDPAPFHPSNLIGAFDFREREVALVSVNFTLDPTTEPAHTRFQEFILKHRERLVARLKQGPALLSEMVSMDGFELQPDEALFDLFGVYSAPKNLDGDEEQICVGISDAVFKIESQGHLVTGSDPVMFLEEPNERQ